MSKLFHGSIARGSYLYGQRRFLGTALGCVILAAFVSLSVSACTGGGPPSSAPISFSPGGTPPATPTASASNTAGTATPSASAITPSASASATAPSASASPSPSPSASPIPAVAPATGGGGTAGFRDVLLFSLGVLAVLAGAGSIVYRRKVMRNR